MYVKSYSHMNIQVEHFSRTHGHISPQVQGTIIHACNLN